MRNLTVQWYVPASVAAPTLTVSVNANVSPLVPVRLAGRTAAEMPASQATVCVTVTGRFVSSLRIASDTWSGVAFGKKLPSVAVAIAAAWPVALRPSPPAETPIAITRMFAATSAAITWACVWPPLGSCPEASPNQTTIRDDPVRNPVAGFVASSKRAFSCASGTSQPSPTAQALMPACAVAIDGVTAWLSRYANGSAGQLKSRYSAAPNCESGWSSRTLFMIEVALVRTFAIAAFMLNVVSARKTMSGFGGIGDVSTLFATTSVWPGRRVAVTDVGVTPGAAYAAPLSMTVAAVTTAAASRPVLICMRNPPVDGVLVRA